MAFTASFTNRYVFVIDVTYLTNSCHAVYWNVSQLTGWKSDQCEVTFFCHQLSHDTSCTSKLCALAWVKLNVVDEGTNRNVCQRQCVTGLDVCMLAGFDYVANFQAVWSEDVSLLAVFVLNQSDVSGAVWIVLEGEYSCRHIYFVTFEVDDTVFSSVTATTMANSDATVAVTS